jgi:Baseplate J-like protein
MAMRVLYLDVDDEITSAASRIRSAEEIRVAVVLPYGSRVATSRINFRLLARDATLNGKRLSVIAGDAATRALAASAGLPIFSNVAEYETALEAERGERAETNGAGAGASVAAGGAPPAAAPLAASPLAASPSTDEAPPADAPSPADEALESASPAKTARSGAPPRGGTRRKGTKPGIGEVGTTAAALATPLALPFDTPEAAAPAVPPATPSRPPAPSVPERPIARAPSVVPAERVMADTPSRPAILERPFAPLATRMPIVIGVAVLALALVVGGVGAFVLLPTATVVITPREEPIGPVELRITASPQATEPDQATKVVPALTKNVEVDANQSFEVTGKRVDASKATGSVRFRNFDFTSSNTIPKGSVVSTQSGIRFRTDKTVTVKRAERVLFQIVPASASVAVTAVNAGPEGNVEPNTIVVIPRGEDPLTLDVTNPDTTRGGKRDEFPRVAQADIDKAMTTLRDQLDATFREKVADPGLAADGTTVFPETAALGEPTFTVDPATLLGEEVPTFELGATATGTVLAVDEAAVNEVAAADIATHVQPGHTLVDGSSEVRPSQGVVEGGLITFPVVITARQVLDLDTSAIENEIRGKSLAEAQTMLQRYGAAEVSVWPDWVSTIPTLDARVDVRSTAEGGTAP